MNNLSVLLKNYLFTSFNLNKFRRKTNNKDFFKTILIGFVFIYVFVILSVGAYSMAKLLAEGLSTMGRADLIIVFAFISSSLLTLFFSIYSAQGVLFSSNDYNIIHSLPIKERTILFSKILFLLITNYIYSMFVYVPFAYFHFKYNDLNMIGILSVVLGFFIIPIIPTLIGSIISFGLVFISSKLKHSNLVSIVLTFALLGAYMYGTTQINQYLPLLITNSEEIFEKMNLYYPLTGLYLNSVVDGSLGSMLLFIIIPIGFLYLIISLLHKQYKVLVSGLREKSRTTKYVHKESIQSSVVKALYIKEFKRYFASYIYVLNTSLGVILLIGISIATFFFDLDTIFQVLEVPFVADLLPGFLVLFIASTVVLSNTTGVSISIEGKNLWQLRALPVEEMKVFMAKAFMNLSLTIPAIIISSVILTINLQLDLKLLVYMLVLPTILAVFTSFLGLLVNLNFPKLDWVNEVVVVKQSLSVMLTLGLCALSLFIPAYIFYQLNITNVYNYLNIVGIIFTLFTIISYYLLKTIGVNKFRTLE